MSEYRKNIAVSYGAQMVSVTCNFLCSLLAARMLGKGGQGELALYVSFTAFITLLAGLGLPSALVFFLASKKINRGKVIPLFSSVTLILLIAFAVFFTIARQMNLLQIFLPDFLLNHNTWAMVLLAHLLFMMMNQYFSALLQAENKFTLAGLLTVIGSVSLLLLYSVNYFEIFRISGPAIYWVIRSLLLVAGLQFAIYLILVYHVDKRYLHFESFSLAEIKPLWWFAGLAYAANVVQFLNYRMDLWFINYFHHSEAMIGVYALAVTLAQLVWHLPNAVHNVLFTFASSDINNDAKIAKTSRTSGWLLLYATGAGLSGYLLSIWLVPLWFGSDFAEVSQLIGILLLGIVPFSYGIGISAYFAGTRRVQINMQGSMIGLLFCIVFDVLLIPAYGITGAAAATVISYLSTVGYYYYRFIQIVKASKS
jgi:O-antigen/teichoic acid export membrane protein